MSIERAYYDDGKIRFESDFIDGLPHGTQRHWHSNGQLAMVIIFDHGAMDGVTQQWNEQGKFLGSCKMEMGTGIYRMWYPNGQLMIETSYVGRMQTGRQRNYFEDGTLICETYWLKNNKISKKKYEAACQQDPSLPRFPDESSPQGVGSLVSYNKPSAQASALSDDMILEILQKPGVIEARSWLQEDSGGSRTLGESMSQSQSRTLVKRIYNAGAVAVYAFDIQGNSPEDQNSGRLIIELPEIPLQRKKIFKIYNKLAWDVGYDPEADAKQKYLLTLLD